MTNKGKSDRGVRTEESDVDEDIPVTDATAGDEGIDEAPVDKPFKPGKPETYSNTTAEQNDANAESVEANLDDDQSAPERRRPLAPHRTLDGSVH